jgi:hypothetical protein
VRREASVADVIERFVRIMTLPTPCDQCCRGWVHTPDGWFLPCTVCEGLGELTLTRLSKLCDVDEQTLKGIWTMRRKTHKKTALKVLDAIAKLMQKPKQLELAR